MRTLPTALFAIAALLGACGDATTTTPEILDPHGPPFGIEVIASDVAFDPVEWVVPTSALLIVDFDNQDDVEHWFVVIEEGRIEDSADFDESRSYPELRAGPGELVSGTFLAPSAPGEYQVICKVPGHLEAGMEGLLIVER